MTLDEAKIVLANMTNEDRARKLQLAGFAGGEVIELNGIYTAAELEAIAGWMREVTGRSQPHLDSHSRVQSPFWRAGYHDDAMPTFGKRP